MALAEKKVQRSEAADQGRPPNFLPKIRMPFGPQQDPGCFFDIYSSTCAGIKILMAKTADRFTEARS
jgi:hypothetical protein